jgi:hypothetical protein
MKLMLAGVLTLLFTACAPHVSPEQATLRPVFTPIHAFSGRLLVISPKKKFQVEIDWEATENKGELRLTHGLSGRIVEVIWQNEAMLWRDTSVQEAWQTLQEQDLAEMGILLPPWDLAKVFTGDMPASMKQVKPLYWQGQWDEADLKVKWSETQQRLELMDLKRGQKAVVIFDE